MGFARLEANDAMEVGTIQRRAPVSATGKPLDCPLNYLIRSVFAHSYKMHYYIYGMAD
jgi:hypothetical protein